ncbi:MAG: hypothetical protein LQ352_001632, partial [Teloschistes flavicans]
MSMRKHNSDFLLSTNVGAPIRIRRAIHLNDLVLVKRIIKNHPEQLQNPDYDDNGNTSLHLAARLGLIDIAVSEDADLNHYLIDAGHEDESISRNANGDTPIHLAVETSLPLATLLATTFPHCIAWKNKQGADAIMLSARTSPSPPASSTTSTAAKTSPTVTTSLPPFHQRTTSASPPPLLATLLTLSPVPSPTLLAQADDDGNTALHYASAYGQLRAIRALLAAGA